MLTNPEPGIVQRSHMPPPPNDRKYNMLKRLLVEDKTHSASQDPSSSGADENKTESDHVQASHAQCAAEMDSEITSSGENSHQLVEPVKESSLLKTAELVCEAMSVQVSEQVDSSEANDVVDEKNVHVVCAEVEHPSIQGNIASLEPTTNSEDDVYSFKSDSSEVLEQAEIRLRRRLEEASESSGEETETSSESNKLQSPRFGQSNCEQIDSTSELKSRLPPSRFYMNDTPQLRDHMDNMSILHDMNPQAVLNNANDPLVTSTGAEVTTEDIFNRDNDLSKTEHIPNARENQSTETDKSKCAPLDQSNAAPPKKRGRPVGSKSKKNNSETAKRASTERKCKRKATTKPEHVSEKCTKMSDLSTSDTVGFENMLSEHNIADNLTSSVQLFGLQDNSEVLPSAPLNLSTTLGDTTVQGQPHDVFDRSDSASNIGVVNTSNTQVTLKSGSQVKRNFVSSQQQVDLAPIYVNTQLANDFLEVYDDDLRKMQREADANKQRILCMQVPLSTGENQPTIQSTDMPMLNNMMFYQTTDWRGINPMVNFAAQQQIRPDAYASVLIPPLHYANAAPFLQGAPGIYPPHVYNTPFGHYQQLPQMQYMNNMIPRPIVCNLSNGVAPDASAGVTTSTAVNQPIASYAPLLVNNAQQERFSQHIPAIQQHFVQAATHDPAVNVGNAVTHMPQQFFQQATQQQRGPGLVHHRPQVIPDFVQMSPPPVHRTDDSQLLMPPAAVGQAPAALGQAPAALGQAPAALGQAPVQQAHLQISSESVVPNVMSYPPNVTLTNNNPPCEDMISMCIKYLISHQ